MALLIPNRKPPAKESFPTSPVDVAMWLEELHPLVDGKAKRTLYKGLKHSNRLENSNRNRVEILSILEPAVDEVLDALADQYREQPLPLPRKPSNAHQLASDLLHELAFAWKIVVNDTYASLLGGQSGLRNIALFRALRVLAKIILHNALVHRSLPDGLLHDANVLYKLAEESGMAEQILELASDEGAQWSVAHAYAHIQLLSLSNLHSQRTLQIPMINRLLEHAAEGLSMERPTRKFDMTQNSYCVHLEQDVPAARWFNLQPALSRDLRVFDCSDVLQKLISARKRAPSSVSREQQINTLSRRSLVVLMDMLARRNERSSQRRVTHRHVSVEGGIKEIFANVTHSKSLDSDASSPNTQRWIILNESRKGMCLRWHRGSPADLQVGEVIALSMTVEAKTTSAHDIVNPGPNPQTDLLGQVQWIRNEGATNLLCGLQLMCNDLRQKVAAVLVEGLSESTKGSKLECLLINSDDGHAESLLTPHHAYHESCTIRIHSEHSEIQQWILRQHIQSTGAFDQFSLSRSSSAT